MRWLDADQVVRDTFDTGYALRLTFGAVAGNHISGSIYFCAPDDTKSYIAGSFVAEIRKPKAPAPRD